MRKSSNVVVLGAGGHTGRFVMDMLGRRGAAPIAATRSGKVLANGNTETPCRAIDVADPASLNAALAGADAVINCAGPFLDTAEPVAEAALRARIPYLDVTAEQTAALRLFERLDARAKDAGVAIVPAMAFYGGLADLLVSALVRDHAKVDLVEIAVGLDSWHPTQGTRRTGERNTFARMIVRDGKLAPVPDPPPSRRWHFPAPLGEQPVTCVALSEIVLLSRHIAAGAITSFMNLKPLEDLGNAQTPPPKVSGASGRSAQQFVMDVRVVADGRHSRATARGQDIYAVSAPLVVNACLALLDRKPALSGVRAPGELFEPRAFLAGLAPELTVEFFETETVLSA